MEKEGTGTCRIVAAPRHIPKRMSKTVRHMRMTPRTRQRRGAALVFARRLQRPAPPYALMGPLTAAIQLTCALDVIGLTLGRPIAPH
jgi:hypothetical protein